MPIYSKKVFCKRVNTTVSRFISIIFSLIITLSASLIFISPALAAIGLNEGQHLDWIWRGNLAIPLGQLSACPESPNCVVSQNGDEDHSIAAIPYTGDRATAKETLLKVLSVVPRTEVIEDTDNYIHAESTSRLFKFVDDAEFYFPEDENVIHVRSASRVGESDLGVNRRRIEQIRLAMEDLGA